jgi:hypothetical protein
MYDNLLRHKILMKILEYKLMYEMKKESFFSYDALADHFGNKKRFSTAFLKLMEGKYVQMKKENGVKKINIEESGVFAATCEYFRQKNNRLFWMAVKDYGMLAANITVAIVAIMALTTNNRQMRDDIKSLEDKLKQIQEQVLQPTVKYNLLENSPTYLFDSLTHSLSKKQIVTKQKDTAALKHSPIDKPTKPK